MHNLLKYSIIFITITLLLFNNGNCNLLADEGVPAYLNKSNPVAMRIADLMNRMTLEEKI